jgi:flavin reductase (DIM6/NTAB) family NADH-FMN oxidoreductase RutF
VVIGEVVFMHIDDALINERFHIDAAKLAAIGRMGGVDYVRTSDRFEMPRGRSALA